MVDPLSLFLMGTCCVACWRGRGDGLPCQDARERVLFVETGLHACFFPCCLCEPMLPYPVSLFKKNDDHKNDKHKGKSSKSSICKKNKNKKKKERCPGGCA